VKFPPCHRKRKLSEPRRRKCTVAKLLLLKALSLSQSEKLFWDILDSHVACTWPKSSTISYKNLPNDLFVNENSQQEWLQQGLDFLWRSRKKWSACGGKKKFLHVHYFWAVLKDKELTRTPINDCVYKNSAFLICFSKLSYECSLLFKFTFFSFQWWNKVVTGAVSMIKSHPFEIIFKWDV